MLAEYPSTLEEKDIVTLISEAISNGVAQSACIWAIIRSEIPDYAAPEHRQECYARYKELTAFIQEKGLYVSEPSQLML